MRQLAIGKSLISAFLLLFFVSVSLSFSFAEGATIQDKITENSKSPALGSSSISGQLIGNIASNSTTTNTANNSAATAKNEALSAVSSISSKTVTPVVASFADIVEPLIPAVVNVYTVKYNKVNKNSRANPFPEGLFPFDQFSDFFEHFDTPFGFDEMYSNPKAVSLGSGFIIDEKGFIVTNHHVIANADEIYIKLPDNSELPAKLIGSDKKTDLALLKVESKSALPFVKFGDSAKARVGDWIIAIGNPFGLGGTVTTGIISSKGRDIEINTSGIVDDFIQTDAAINTGNSGGPMFNLNGEVIGVNTAIFSPSGTNIGIGFAIPASTAKNIVKQLQETGKVSRGRLDVTIQEITPEIAEGLGLKETSGVLVVEVLAGGAGASAGIKSGDVITEFAGQPVKTSRKLQVLVAETPVNKPIKITVIRDNKTLQLSGKILELNEPQESVKNNNESKNANNSASSSSTVKNNVTFTDLDNEVRLKYGLGNSASGVLVTKVSKYNKTLGLKVGDLVLAVNQQPISTASEFGKLYEDAKSAGKKNILLFVKRRNSSIFIAFPIEQTNGKNAEKLNEKLDPKSQDKLGEKQDSKQDKEEEQERKQEPSEDSADEKMLDEQDLREEE